MMDETQQQSLVTRFNRIEGQVRGIRRMVQEPRVCVELLQQLSAAEAALNRISLAVVRYHVERCVPDGIVQGEPEASKRLTELVDIFDRFAKLALPAALVRNRCRPPAESDKLGRLIATGVRQGFFDSGGEGGHEDTSTDITACSRCVLVAALASAQVRGAGPRLRQGRRRAGAADSDVVSQGDDDRAEPAAPDEDEQEG